MRIIILLLAILLPDIVSADLFTPPPTDKSVDFLGHIFGPTIGGVNLHGVANPALLHMFERFNAAIITLGTMIIGYIAIISTINTAQEGQIMGRKWSSAWIPLRSALGMMVLIPTPTSGYSIAQSIIMWCIMQGIGGADSIWNGILNDMSHGLSASQALTRQADDEQASRVYDALDLIGAEMAGSLLRSAVCMQTIHKIFYNTAIPPAGGFNTPARSHVKTYGGYVQPYVTYAEFNPNSAQHAEYSGTLRIGVPGVNAYSEVCGKYSVTGKTTRDEWDRTKLITEKDLQAKAHDIFEHKILALQFMLQYFSKLADQIADQTVTPRDAHNRLLGTAEDPIQPGGYRSAAINTYREILKMQVKPQQIDSLNNIIYQGKQNGWLAAGSFYFALNQTQHVNFFADVMTPPATHSIPNCDDPRCSIYAPDQYNLLNPNLNEFLQFGPEISYLATRLWDTKTYLEHDFTMVSDRLALNTSNALTNKPMHAMQSKMLNLLHDMMHEQHNDPLIAQGRFGSSIMLLTERAWLDAQNELHVLLSRAEDGKVPIDDELMQRLHSLNQRGAVAIAVYSIVWVIGAVLAIYVPLIPYLIFTLGVVGWLLLVIEAIVAAPILAIGFMLPTNEEMGKMLHGLLLLLNIVLRPIMMLFGFVLATRLYQAVVKLVNFGMLANFDTLNTTDSLFAWIGILALYATFIIALSNKCFSLIYALPDRILRWMGGIPEQSDPTQELHLSKSGLMKAVDTSNKISMGLPERSFARLQTRSKQLAPPDAVTS